MNFLMQVACAAAAIPPIACLYPFSASEATVQSYGFTGRVPLSNGDQTFTYTIQGALGAAVNYAAMPEVLGTLNAASGIVTFEAPFTDPTFSGGTTAQLVTQSYILYTAAFADHIRISRVYRADGTKGLYVAIAGAQVYSANHVLGYIGVELNATTSRLTVKADNVVVVAAAAYTPQALTPVFVVAEEAGVSGTYAGQTANSTFRSNSDDYQGTYTAGALNVCGGTV